MQSCSTFTLCEHTHILPYISWPCFLARPTFHQAINWCWFQLRANISNTMCFLVERGAFHTSHCVIIIYWYTKFTEETIFKSKVRKEISNCFGFDHHRPLPKTTGLWWNLMSTPGCCGGGRVARQKAGFFKYSFQSIRNQSRKTRKEKQETNIILWPISKVENWIL